MSDLERSLELSENRRIFRSQLLLDQDRAVGSANLADIYNDAGMTDVSVREAVRGVNSDYANYSAHLFLANSYDRLRDPNQINLRYETPFFSERERAALAWTEAVTRVSESHVPDETYETVREHFTEKELVDLTLAIVAINGWNRLAISFRTVPGSYQPSKH